MDVIVVGSVMVDVSVEAAALAPGGDVHGRVRVRPGGSAANAAVWAAAAGAATRLYGRVGDDLAGRLVSEALAEWSVDAALAVDHAVPTGSTLVVHDAADRSMVADRGANAHLAPGDLPADLEAGAVLVSGYILVNEGSMEAGRAAIERAHAPFVAVDAASWPLVEAFGVERFFEVTGPANVLLANEREAEVLSGFAAGEAAAKELGRRYPMACVKLGAEGAVAAWDGRTIHEPAEPVEEVDPTGAGDAFDGALLAALVRGTSPEEALRAACRAGARVAASSELWPEDPRP